MRTMDGINNMDQLYTHAADLCASKSILRVNGKPLTRLPKVLRCGIERPIAGWGYSRPIPRFNTDL